MTIDFVLQNLLSSNLLLRFAFEGISNGQDMLTIEISEVRKFASDSEFVFQFLLTVLFYSIFGNPINFMHLTWLSVT